ATRHHIPALRPYRRLQHDALSVVERGMHRDGARPRSRHRIAGDRTAPGRTAPHFADVHEPCPPERSVPPLRFVLIENCHLRNRADAGEHTAPVSSGAAAYPSSTDLRVV